MLQSVETKLMQSVKDSQQDKNVPKNEDQEPDIVPPKKGGSKRPALVKQKHSFTFPALQEEESPEDVATAPEHPADKAAGRETDDPDNSGANEGPFDQKKSFEDIKEEVKSMPSFDLSVRRKSSTDVDPGTVMFEFGGLFWDPIRR